MQTPIKQSRLTDLSYGKNIKTKVMQKQNESKNEHICRRL